MSAVPAVVAVTLLVLLVVGAVTGRVKVSSCCGSDARCDARMRAAFEDEAQPDEGAQQMPARPGDGAVSSR